MKIAHMIHNVYGAGIIAGLGDDGLEMPRDASVLQDWMAFPQEGKFFFLGQDLAKRMKMQWGRIMIDLQKAKFSYDWVHEHKPDAILFWTDEYPNARGAITAARESNIPTVEVVHGSIHTEKLGHWAGKKHADWIIGASWEFRDCYKAANPELVDNIIVTGNVTQDPYATANHEVRAAARQELQLGSCPTVTFLTDAVFKRGAWQDPALRYQAALDFFHAFKMLRYVIPDLQLIVKVHPYEKMNKKQVTTEDYAKLIKAAGISKNFTIMDEPLVVAIAAADLIVGNASSAMATGYHFGVPALVLGYEPWHDHQKYADRGALCARNERDILPMMSSILLNEHSMFNMVRATERGVEYFSGTKDGKAAWRCVQAAKAIAQGQRPGEECWIDPETPPRKWVQPETELDQRGQSGIAGSGFGGRPELASLALENEFDLGDLRRRYPGAPIPPREGGGPAEHHESDGGDLACS